MTAPPPSSPRSCQAEAERSGRGARSRRSLREPTYTCGHAARGAGIARASAPAGRPPSTFASQAVALQLRARPRAWHAAAAMPAAAALQV